MFVLKVPENTIDNNIHFLYKIMTKMYVNELLGLSRTEIRKEWDNCWEKITKLNPVKDVEELVELNKMFDKCVEAYYANDCGDYWVVNSASRVNGKYGTYKVMKDSGQGTPVSSSLYNYQGIHLEEN